MSRAVEMRRVPGGTVVDPSSKGLGESGDPDEWLITIRLSDRANRPWSLAWREQVRELEGELHRADWQFDEDAQRIYLWATEDKAEALIQEFDAMLERANARAAEIVAESAERRAANDTLAVRDEAARLQERLNVLAPRE